MGQLNRSLPVMDIDDFARPAWQSDAACRGLGPALFFPELGHDRDVPKMAKAICADCPVRSECLEYGIHERFGIWGGLAIKERRVVLALRRTSKASQDVA